MAALTVATMTKTGDDKSYQTCNAGGDTVVNDGKTFLHFKNTGTSKTVTIDSVVPCSQGFDHNESITVGATTGDETCGFYEVSRYGTVLTITYSPDATGLTCAPVRTPQQAV
jgi:hypothetical protein